MTRDDITKKELLQKVNQIFDKGGIIDVVAFAHDELNIDVYEDPDMNDKTAVIRRGKKAGTYFINVNPSQPSERQRSSVAHEIAHFILHRNTLDNHLAIARDGYESLSANEEKQANELAAMILMPKKHFNKIAKGLGLTKDKYIESYSAVNKLAKKLKVSFSACMVRLKELGYNVEYL